MGRTLGPKGHGLRTSCISSLPAPSRLKTESETEAEALRTPCSAAGHGLCRNPEPGLPQPPWPRTGAHCTSSLPPERS